MTDVAPIRLLVDSAPAAPVASGAVRLEVRLPVRDETMVIAADVPEGGRISLADVVPLAYDIEDRLMAIYLRQAAADGREIFCRKGCGVCCERYLVRLAPAEMYYLSNRMASLDGETGRAARQWFEEAADLAASCGLLGRLRSGEASMDFAADWWLAQDMPKCPFLAGGLCGIYSDRFVVCREHCSYVPPERCATLETSRMPVPYGLFDPLCLLEERLTGEPMGAICLPLVNLYAHRRAAESKRTWNAVAVVETFFQVLAEVAEEARQRRGGARTSPSGGEDAGIRGPG